MKIAYALFDGITCLDLIGGRILGVHLKASLG